MKNLSIVDKLIYFINSVLAVMLLLSYTVNYIKPSISPYLSILSLSVPVLIVINLFFVLYWLIKLKKQFIVSLLVLLIGYSQFFSFFKISNNVNRVSDDNISVMSYNVRLFNLYQWMEVENIGLKIQNLINEYSPDVVSLQEYTSNDIFSLNSYPFNHFSLSDGINNYGLAFYSKLPIVNSGVLKSENTNINATYIDVLKNNDTLRFYNIHLKSFKLESELKNIDSNNSDKIISLFDTTFNVQEDQAFIISNHIKNSPHKVVISGDFNNTAYSYVYKLLKDDLKDSFVESGSGFGSTYNFKYFPMRIDFILVDKSIRVNDFKTIDKKLSDHFPIISIFNL